MIKSEFYIPSTNGVNRLHVVMWKPEAEILAVLQISHGMVEYIDRYDRFANYLANQGILVVGIDHLGHGKSVAREDDLGYFHPKHAEKIVVDDLYELTKRIKQEYKDIPYFVLGHSMGSFFIRRYAMTYGKSVDGVIIMGTGNQSYLNVLLSKILVNACLPFRGGRHRSIFVKTMIFMGYNKRIKEIRTPVDWLTKDKEIVDKYQKDKYCTFVFTLNGYKTLANALSYVMKSKNIAKIPKDLPILMVSGAEDPVGEYGKGVKRAYRNFKKQGLEHVELKLYPNDRHEILNEVDYENVYADILEWLQKNIKRQ